MSKKKKGKYTKDSAKGILFANEIEVKEREVVAPTLIAQVADNLRGKKRIERLIVLRKAPGIKLWGVIDYLVGQHNYEIVWE